jgi:hypothetical protein
MPDLEVATGLISRRRLRSDSILKTVERREMDEI